MTSEMTTSNCTLDYTLFLGVEVTPMLERELSKINPALLELFCGPDYLIKVMWQEKIFLGKPLDSSIEISVLENAYDHVFSLLKRLVPSFLFSKEDLILFGRK